MIEFLTTQPILNFPSIELNLRWEYVLAFTMTLDIVMGVLSSIFERNVKEIENYKNKKIKLPFFKRMRIYYTTHLENFTTPKLINGFISKITLLAFPMILAIGALILGMNLNWMLEVSIKMLIASDLISSINHFIYIRTGKKSKNLDFLSIALDKFKKLTTEKLLNSINKEE